MTVHSLRSVRLTACALALATPVLSHGAASAQSASEAAATPIDAEAMARASAQQRLTTALARIAQDGSDGAALSDAGQAALALGDARAAIGFLVRAEALMPRDPVIKAALGATMVQLEEPEQAMRYFDAAVAAGGLDRTYMADRGLAFDMMGNQARAQADYAVAQQSAPSAELTRRWAISLGISGRPDEAVQKLAPLLRGQDRAAWRSRAMILAMNGRTDEARQIARQTLPPELAEALDSYFPLMDRLTPPQLAAASHFGRFPGYDQLRAQPSRSEAVRLAAAQAAPPPAAAASTTSTRTRSNSRRDREGRRTGTRNRTTVAAAAPSTPAAVPAAPRSTGDDMGPPPPPPAPAQRVAAAPAPAPAPGPAPVAATRAPSPLPTVAAPSVQVASAAATASQSTLPVASAPATVASATAVAGPPDSGDVRPGFTANPVAVAGPAAAQPPAMQPGSTTPAVAAGGTVSAPPASAPVTTVVTGWSLADVVQSMEVPEAERAASAEALSLAEVERIAQEQREARAAAAEAARLRAADQARQRTEAEARRRAEAQAAERAEQQRLRAHPARIWVQVATGSPVSALAGDYRRLTRRFPQQFEGQSGATTPWNRANRLLVGPFRNAAAARAWDSAYRAAGGQSFVWNSEAGEEVTPLPRR